MRRMPIILTLAALAVSIVPGIASSTSEEPSLVRAGYGEADATWHVGVGSGQYAAKSPNALGLATGGDIDPHNHANVQQRSYGVQSRLSYRTIVVEGSNGKRVALVKTDGYLASDLLTRRAAQILRDQYKSSIGYDQIMQTASHNHSSPFYMSPAWGVWLFQDVFEIRIFEHHARAMADSIREAELSLQPARMGATTIRHSVYKGQIAGATITDDGTPGGYPETYHDANWNPFNGHSDDGAVVIRFDTWVDNAWKPRAVWVNHGQHPESLDAYDLITADFLAPLERMVQRDTGVPLVYSQGDVGSAEGPYCSPRDPQALPGGGIRPSCDFNEKLPDGVVRAWAHTGHAQTERGARYLADSIVKAFNDIGAGNAQVPFTTNFPVGYVNGFVPLPVSHPYPSVSNCRTETTAEGDPGSPILGLPDCERAHSNIPGVAGPDKNPTTNMIWENLKAHGIPLPEHYDAPSFAAVEENLRIHLQAFRLGEVVIASCACEAQMDIILNFESRADKVTGNMFNGYDWSQWCEGPLPPEGSFNEQVYKCKNPGSRNLAAETSTITIGKARYDRMVAQVNNDAKDWDQVENALAANAEPADPSKIWGNFTHGELGSDKGYAIAVGVGHAGDYNGYTVSYREYMSRDHYRKALTCCGPHTADYMSTRMVKMAELLRNEDAATWKLPPEPFEPVAIVDEARHTALAEAIGAASSAAYESWQAALPNDVGPVAALSQPASSFQHFGAAHFTWRGGSNALDNPVAKVQRLVDGNWVDYAEQSGEVVTRVTFPKGAQGVIDTYSGSQEWKWTASFEAFRAFPAPVVEGGGVPFGTYKFVVGGKARQGGSDVAYDLESAPFDVVPWTGITVSGIAVNDGDSSFVVNHKYPVSYSGSPFPFIVNESANRLVCRRCTFRPWATIGSLSPFSVKVVRNGVAEYVPATFNGTTWVADTNLGAGDTATIEVGAITDDYGETNGAAYTIQ